MQVCARRRHSVLRAPLPQRPFRRREAGALPGGPSAVSGAQTRNATRVTTKSCKVLPALLNPVIAWVPSSTHVTTDAPVGKGLASVTCLCAVQHRACGGTEEAPRALSQGGAAPAPVGAALLPPRLQ